MWHRAAPMQTPDRVSPRRRADEALPKQEKAGLNAVERKHPDTAHLTRNRPTAVQPANQNEAFSFVDLAPHSGAWRQSLQRHRRLSDVIGYFLLRSGPFTRRVEALRTVDAGRPRRSQCDTVAL
jgi:hypothetical protein